MTARRATERELERRAADLARMNADLETFAYAASHDLQEPLRVIRLAGELLSRLPEVRTGEESDMLVHQVMSSAERMSAQLDGLLEFVRAAPSGQPAAQVASADLALDDALETLRLVIEESGATIERTSLPDVPVPRAQLAHVFQNLVANAVKFREPERSPVLRIGAQRAGGVWQITVEDDGIGIAREHRERVFGVFARLHQDVQYPGTGIGLPLCRKILERHGGTIAVADRPGPGTTLVLTIPAEAAA
jgi:light-regulated signal transduction histidine kinase (bacteriophytochrome)